MRTARHNLKIWVSSMLLFLVGAPFVASAFLPLWLADFRHPTAADIGLVAGFASGRYDFALYLAGSVLIFPILLLIGWNPRFARFCARDPELLPQTIATTRRTAWIVGVIAVLCLGTLIYELVASANVQRRSGFFEKPRVVLYCSPGVFRRCGIWSLGDITP